MPELALNCAGNAICLLNSKQIKYGSEKNWQKTKNEFCGQFAQIKREDVQCNSRMAIWEA